MDTIKKMTLKKKIAIAIMAVLLVLAFLFWAVFGDELATLGSINKIIERNDDNKQGSVYEIKVAGDYYFDDFLRMGGVSNDGDLIDFITSKITKGLINMKIEKPEIACSAFTAKLANGDFIMARNYDFEKTNSAIVLTDSPKGAKSVSSVDLHFLDLSPDKDVEGISDNIKMLATTYTPLDGLNEHGLSVAIFMTYQGDKTVATNQNTEKPDITSTTLLRLMLDKASNVDEAVELAKKYDMHDSAGTSFHYMVADASGRSAVLEWANGTDKTDNDGSKRKLHVTYNDKDEHIGSAEAAADYQWVTNFILLPNYYESDEDKSGFDRYKSIESQLNEKNGVLKDETEALEILKSVGRRHFKPGKHGITVHSAIFNLTQGTVLWVGNENFDKVDEYKRYSLKH